MNNTEINLKLTLNEASILKKIIQRNTPDTSDEMIVLMLYSRITKLIEEKHG